MNIYKTINKINGKVYIGQDTKDRPDYFGSGILIIRALAKYGKDSFDKEILEECCSREDLDDREIYWIKKFNSTDLSMIVCAREPPPSWWRGNCAILSS